MNIGQAVRLIRASATMPRYWEQIGFLARAVDTADGHRTGSQMLRLVRHSRALVFTIEWGLILLQLWRARSGADAGTIARRRVDALKRRITDMQAMMTALEHLASAVKGDARGDGPPVDDMAEDKAAMAAFGRTRIFPGGALWFTSNKPALIRWCVPTVRRT